MFASEPVSRSVLRARRPWPLSVRVVSGAVAGLLTLVLLLPFSIGAQQSGKLLGIVWSSSADGHYKLRTGREFVVGSATKIKHGWDDYKGILRVGWVVEVRGVMDGAAGSLRAEKISIKSMGAKGRVEGEAIIEQVTGSGRAVEILADGRLLRVGRNVRPLKGSAGDTGTIAPQAASAGSVIRYKGKWTEEGVIAVHRVVVFENAVDPGEAELWREFIPAVQMSASDSDKRLIVRAGSRRFRLSGSGAVQDYVQRLGRALVPESLVAEDGDEAAYRFNFMLADGAQPQALAFPGGAIVINSGLLAFAENEAQVAFVIGHEIAHVIEEHAWRERRYHRSKSFRWATAGIGYLVEQVERKGYSRASEDQADRLAIWYMTQAGFDPREAYRFLERVERLGLEVMTLGWFDSHRPLVLRKQSILDELPHLLGREAGRPGPLRRDSVEFRRMRILVPSQRLTARPAVD